MTIIKIKVSVDKAKGIPSFYRKVDSIEDAQKSLGDEETLKAINGYLKSQDTVNNGRKYVKAINAEVQRRIATGEFVWNSGTESLSVVHDHNGEL